MWPHIAFLRPKFAVANPLPLLKQIVSAPFVIMQLLQGLYYMAASLHLQYSSTLKMEAAYFSKTLVNFHHITQHHILKASISHASVKSMKAQEILR